MILVIGATGTVGTEVVKQLIQKNASVRVLVRDAAKAQKLGKVDVAVGDLEKPETLDAAFKGAERVFVLSTGPAIPKHDAIAIDAAKKAGAKHVVLLSVMGADAKPGITLGRWHHEGEKKLMESGLAWTLLRPGSFSSNSLAWIGSIKGQGAVYAPTGDGKTAPIDPRDLGAVAAVVLTEAGHEGKAYTLTGPEALNASEQVAILAKVTGKEIKFVDVPESAAREGMLRSGMPEGMVGPLLELMQIIRAGYAGEVSPVVRILLGREALTFEQWARDHAAAFA